MGTGSSVNILLDPLRTASIILSLGRVSNRSFSNSCMDLHSDSFKLIKQIGPKHHYQHFIYFFRGIQKVSVMCSGKKLKKSIGVGKNRHNFLMTEIDYVVRL